MKRIKNPTPQQLKHREYMYRYYHSHIYQKTCLSCSRLFTSKNNYVRYCTDGCAHKRRIAKVCLHCQKNYEVKKSKEVENIFCSRSCAGSYYTGSIARNWRGGSTDERRRVMSLKKYKDWRKAVFERDDYTCIECGDDKGGNLEADHIKPFAHYPELRFDLENGRTLCTDCHKATDTWGAKSKISLFARSEEY